MKAIIYKTLSNAQTSVEIEEGKTIESAFPELDLENAIIVANGKIVQPCYKVCAGDKIMIRLTPSGTTALIITVVVTAVVAVGAGVAGGVAMYKAKKAAEKAAEELEKVKKLTNKSDIDNRPFLRGASNTKATGNQQPYIIGRHFNTPYLLCDPFYELAGTDGANEYTYNILGCGFNSQIFDLISIDNIDIKKFKGDQPQEGLFSIDSSIFAEDGQIEISQDGALLTGIPALNYKVESNQKNDEIAKDHDVSNGTKEYLTYTLNQYAKNVDIAITFPYGLYAYNDDNDKVTTSVTITPQYSLDGGATWSSFTFNNNGTLTNTFSRNESTKELRFVAHKDFSLSDYRTLHSKGQSVIYIRVRSDGNATDSTIHNDCYVLYYQSVCFDPNKSSSPAGILNDNGNAGLVSCNVLEDRERAFCTLLGVRLKATKINEDKLKKINVITRGVARTWDGSSWRATKSATRNPAAWALEIETSDKHPASRRSDDELDLESFGAFYEYCEKQNFKFDYVITQAVKKDTLLGYIMEATGACIYTDIYGRRAIAIDSSKENALAVYNPQNIISIQNKKSFGRKTDGLRIKYINSANDLFQEDTYVVMREINGVPLPLTDDSIIKDLTVTGITEYQHVVKYAHRLMAIEVLRPKTTIIEVGNEGIFYTPYSKVLIQDDSLKIGIGNGFIVKNTKYQNGVLDQLVISGSVTFEENKKYGIIVQCYGSSGATPLPLKVRGTGQTDIIQVDTLVRASDVVKPEEGAILSFGELDDSGEFTHITTAYLISQIRRSDHGYNLELVNYDEAIYDNGKIPAYQSNITQKPSGSSVEIPSDYVTVRELDDRINDIQSGNMPVGKPDTPTSVRGSAGQDGISMSCEQNLGGLRNDIRSIVFIIKKTDGSTVSVSSSGLNATYGFDRNIDGYPEAEELSKWSVSAKAINIYGKESGESESRYISTDSYGTWKLQTPAVNTRLSDRTITLLLSQPERSDSRAVYGNIRYKVQVKRPDIDKDYYKPASSLDPYGSELNYKDGEGYAVSDGVYIQTMPLAGQTTDNITDTAYMFKVSAFNEAGESGTAEITATATCTSIRDIVKAKETAKEAYVSTLSAISANLGVISKGSLNGSDTNYWALSTVTDERTGIKRYEGAMRVGGGDEYLQVTPVINDRGEILKYTIQFKVGNFEVTTEATRLNGELIIQSSADALDRTRISPDGTYYQHRENSSGAWRTIACSNVNGVMTKQVFSDDTLFVSNQDMAGRRKRGDDIGHPYLSNSSRVFHFDTDLLDQAGAEGVAVTDAADGGFHQLVGAETSSDDIDFTPAILAVAPYSTIGRSLYGKYSLSATFAKTSVFTVDFWIQYIYGENQTLLEVGDSDDRISISLRNAECFYMYGEDDPTGCPYNEETVMPRLYRKLERRKCCYFSKGYGGAGYEATAAKPYVDGGKYYVLDTTSGTEAFKLAAVSRKNYDRMVDAGLWVKTIPYNKPAPAQTYAEHLGSTERERRMLGSYEPNTWLHIGVVCDGSNMTLHTGLGTETFRRYAAHDVELSIALNKGRQSFMLDELMVDTAAVESADTFAAHTADRIPWGALDKDKSHFVLTADDPESIRTNIFDSALFKSKVLKIIKESKGETNG